MSLFADHHQEGFLSFVDERSVLAFVFQSLRILGVTFISSIEGCMSTSIVNLQSTQNFSTPGISNNLPATYLHSKKGLKAPTDHTKIWKLSSRSTLRQSFRMAKIKPAAAMTLSHDLAVRIIARKIVKRRIEKLDRNRFEAALNSKTLLPNLSGDLQDRKNSYDMDWEPIHRASLRNSRITPIVHTRGNRVTLEIDTQDAEYLSQRASLYVDVEGQIPPGHKPLTEVDDYNVPLFPTRWRQEIARAWDRSMKPIGNAPPWQKDLPWDELIKNDITIEEMIVYFPNHVAKWPGLALWLRHQAWDRLYYRTVRLINLARGSHWTDNREHQHVEILPFMMKMERAIQEFNRQYQLGNHWSIGEPTQEWWDDNIWRKPAKLENDTNPKMVTLEEAAGYVIGVNEFQHLRFSTMMRNLQPRHRASRDPLVPRGLAGQRLFPFKTIDDASSSASGQPQPPPGSEQPYGERRNDTSNPNNNLPPGDNKMPLNVPLGFAPNNELDDGFGDGPDDNSGHSDNPPPNTTQPRTPSGLCRRDRDCTKRDCKYGHRSPAAPPNINVNLSETCKFGLKCINRKCNRTHPSPTSAQSSEGVPGEIGNGSGGDSSGSTRNGGRRNNAGNGC
jgi:hypothetical protein